ncbi:MAG: hypothetical protein ACK5LC_15580 [Coprobacillaceae bacterium]
MSNVIPFPQKIGEIFGTAARNNGNILAAARKIEIAWEGNRAIAVGSDIPSFQTAYGQTKKSNEKDPKPVNLVTLTLPIDFRIPRQQVEAAKENGTFNALIAERLADALALSTKAVEYAVVHGYDLGAGAKIDVIDPVHGCIDTAVGTRAIDSVSPLKDYGAAIADLDDFNASNIFVTAKHYSETYTDPDGKGQIPFNTAFNYIGIDTQKSDVVGNKKVDGVQDNKLIAGDFSKLVWGVKALSKGLEEDFDGNPRGKGELRDRNEVAYIFEAGYAWGIEVPEAFAVVKAGAVG